MEIQYDEDDKLVALYDRMTLTFWPMTRNTPAVLASEIWLGITLAVTQL